MSASILEFPKPLPRPKLQAEPRAWEYTCSRCQCDLFKLSDDGSVHCGKCDVKIRNLFVRCL